MPRKPKFKLPPVVPFTDEDARRLLPWEVRHVEEGLSMETAPAPAHRNHALIERLRRILALAAEGNASPPVKSPAPPA